VFRQGRERWWCLYQARSLRRRGFLIFAAYFIMVDYISYAKGHDNCAVSGDVFFNSSENPEGYILDSVKGFC
jgi:hypothetical protein